MPEQETSREDRSTAISRARSAARNAAFTLARDAGAQIITRPAYPGSQSSVRDVDPAAGMRAARDLELGARSVALGYVRNAREAGLTWEAISEAIDAIPGGDAQQAGDTAAEAAYTYAAGHPDTETARRYGRSFTWQCRACDRLISDLGPVNGPADDEHGHTENCARHASAIASWDAEWEAAP